MSPEIKYVHDGEWAQVCRSGGGESLMIYPREDGTFSIGRPAGAACWRDLVGQTGFASMQAAVDQAILLAEDLDALRQVWS